jgi:hypothetical protein
VSIRISVVLNNQEHSTSPPSSPVRVSRMQPYEYSPLSTPTSIRIIRLLPAKFLTNESISSCTRQTWRAAQASEALSYTWGDPSERRPMFCKGRTIQVTPNCESALKHLRLRDKVRKIWVDAICINQVSLAEKNAPCRDDMAGIRRGQISTDLAWG